MEWVINNIGVICSIATVLITAVITVITTIKGKESKAVKALKSIANVIKQFPEFIKTAEKISNNPEEKKTYVMDQAVLSCKAEGVELTNEQLIDISERIDDAVALSKSINLHSKTTTELKTIKVFEPMKEEENNENK